MNHNHLNEKIHIKSRNARKAVKTSLCLFIQDQMLGLKPTRKKGKPMQNPRATQGVSGAGSREQVWSPGSALGEAGFASMYSLIKFDWKCDQSLALPQMRGWVGLALLWALTTRRCSCVLGSRTSRCRWGGTACLSAPVFHPETQPRRVHHVAL